MAILHDQLKTLRDNLSEMAGLVSSQLQKSVQSFLQGDPDLAREVIRIERKVNEFELVVDKSCEHVFTLLSPVAHDTRFVFSTLKVNSDLERIGDYADGIAKLAILGEMKFDQQLMLQLEFKKMADLTCMMLEDVIHAYSIDDTVLARMQFDRDKELNEINHNATDVVVDYCRKNPDNIHQALYLLSVIRKLERVGDHICNISEDVIFYVEANTTKHGGQNI